MVDVNVFKILFPAISVAIFVLIFFSIRSVPEADYLNTNVSLADKFNSININNGEIFGLTESRDSFYFTSSEMEYSSSAKTDGYDLILDNLVGQIEYSEEDILYAKSPKAKYWFMKKKIFSINNIFYNNDESVLAKSNNLEIDLKTGTLESKGPTLLSGSNFFITSGYLKLIEPKVKKDGNKMILQFRNNVHASLTPGEN